MEIWDLYDEKRRVTGQYVIRGERVPSGFFHLVVDAFFLNGKGEILIQRRAREKENYPDIWSVTGGSALKGEDSAAACIRECREEMGFAPDFTHFKVLLTETNRRRGFIRDTYLFFQDMPLSRMRFQPEEVQDAMWIFPEKIRENPRLWKELSALSFWEKVYPYLCLESMRVRIPKGIYRHYKGNCYRVEDLSLHSETLEPMVIYRALYGTEEIWVRPAGMWNQLVDVDGQKIPRFAWEKES